MWLRKSMSRRNPSSRTASSPKVEEKTFLLLSSCSMPRRGLSRSSRHLKPISLAKDVHQVLKPKILALGIAPTSLNAASNITHSAIASQDSSGVTTTCSAHCTVHCAARDFNVKICELRCKVGTIPYRTVRMILSRVRLRAQRPGTGSAGAAPRGHSVLQSRVSIMNCDYKK